VALSDDLRKRVVEAVAGEGMSRNAAAKRFGVSIASPVRWLQRFALWDTSLGATMRSSCRFRHIVASKRE
jgi:transposase